MTSPLPRAASLLRAPGARVALAGLGLLLLLGIVLFVRFARQVDALAARRAAGPAWSFPSRVYSDGLTFVSGMALPSGYLRAHLDARGYQPAAPLLAPGHYAWDGSGITIALRGFTEASDPAGAGGPELLRLSLTRNRVTRVSRLGGFEGALAPDTLHPPRLEPVQVALVFDEQQVRRTWVPLERVPQVVRDAVVAAEDRRFYGHMGLDLRSGLRALLTNVRAGGVREGGSTITQQLARGLFLGPRRTWGRKLGEAFAAVGLDLLLSKDRILEMYLNSVYWGRTAGGGVAGIAEAARWYFDLPVDSLGLEEAALLAGLIPAPNATSPFRNPREARVRRDGVLRDLVVNGLLDSHLAAEVRRRPLGVRRGPAPPERFPSYIGYVREALDGLPPGAAEHWGLSIFTTLDLVWQERAETSLGEGLADQERWRGRTREPLQGAFVALEPSSGAVRAMVGGRTPRTGDFNRAFQAKRQPGSAMKPIVYAAALDSTRRGPRFTPASTVPDLRRTFETPQGPWQPENDQGDYHASVTLAKALAKSLNLATANLVEAVGPREVARYAERFGLGRLKPVPSIGLGSNEVTLLALTGAFATFPNRGRRPDVTPIRTIVDGLGRVISAPPLAAVPVVPERTAALMIGLLEDAVIFGVSYPLRKQYGFSRPVGAKTGTTNEYLDAWFVGFTPELVAGVWIGYDTPRSLAAPAAEVALPVWALTVSRLLEGFPATAFESTKDLELVWIDPWNGARAGPNCPGLMRVPFLPGTAPREVCAADHTADWQALFARRLADSLEAARADSAAGGDSTTR